MYSFESSFVLFFLIPVENFRREKLYLSITEIPPHFYLIKYAKELYNAYV